MKILVVTAHPRENSLTQSITERFTEGLAAAGHEYEVADLYAEGFNPLLYPQDEPDWHNPDKAYSEEVQREMARIRASDALAFIFPVWWYSVPAILKGYFDRVWNYGFAYGPAKLPVQKIRWIALVGGTQKKFEKRNYHLMLQQHLNIGLAGYTGVEDSAVHFMYNSTFDEFTEENHETIEAHFNGLLNEAYRIGHMF
ncbi:NAD(P)H oxidoreductase [Paenibacillus larvae]|uniref:NAD(P)H oxidoreductase n=1 Tax=Paenibacillus larvae TaxID=1464 RepID=UPI00227FFE36|nr:NAD(P)H oxidoreductase [Paenibacillus larvae]MCY9510030.1 NAD(P)H oxidoreductase [Paenibacillus larvae]MCY9527317.1 NAD(P)H oxidoreductase [Paenibacillus larvae]